MSLWLLLVLVVIFLVLLTALLTFARSNRKYDISGKHVLVSKMSLLCLVTMLRAPAPRVQVTGGSSGIGKAVAKEALKRGAAMVTLLARDKVRPLSIFFLKSAGL